jgi:hypothetical protein
MAVAEHERQEAELKKVEMKELAAANKLYKEKIAQEKRERRAREKEERDRVKAQKAAKEAQRRNHNAGKSIQLPNPTKRKASGQLQPKRVKKRGGRGARSRSIAAEPPPRPTVTTRSGRTATKHQ